MKYIFALNEDQLEMVTGGTVNDNLTPGDLPDIDGIINDRNYEQIADYLAYLISRNDPNSTYNRRFRGVNNNVNIYDLD